MTASGGDPVTDNQNFIATGPRGTWLVQDYQLIEKLALGSRERVPDAVNS